MSNGGPIPFIRAGVGPAFAADPDTLPEEVQRAIAEQRAAFARAEEEARVRAWAIERRELWKAVVLNASVGSAIRGELPGDEVRQAANQALKWFDETWGHEFPVSFDLTGGKVRTP